MWDWDRKRFERICQQGTLSVMEGWVNRATGINDLFRQSGNAGGLTPFWMRRASLSSAAYASADSRRERCPRAATKAAAHQAPGTGLLHAENPLSSPKRSWG